MTLVGRVNLRREQRDTLTDIGISRGTVARPGDGALNDSLVPARVGRVLADEAVLAAEFLGV
jgi:hypothetical protein